MTEKGKNMTIYEIDKRIEELLSEVDETTGELLVDTEQLEALQMEKEQKIENLALAVKNLTAEAAAIKAEEEALAKRRKSVENEADRAKKYLDFVLGGEKYKSAKVSVSYRCSEKIEPDEQFVEWAMSHAEEFLRYKAPEADKTAIKAAIKNGRLVEHVRIVPTMSMQIK